MLSRFLGAVVSLGLALAAPGVHAENPPPSGARRAAPATEVRALLLPVRAGAVYRGIDGGVLEWWRAELASGGVALVPRREAERAIAAVAGPEQRPLHGADASAVARAAGASHVLTTELHYRDGAAEVWMRAYDGASGKVVAVGHAEGKLAKLGELLAEASRPLRAALAASGEPEIARLAEFSLFERVGDAFRAGRPADAAPLLAGAKGRVAESLRGELAESGSDPELPLAERSRIASATGSDDPNWLRVRQGLIDGEDPELLLAGAANAEARGEHARALELARQAGALLPDDLRPRIAAARALSALDRHADARAAWEQVLAADPHQLEAQNALARNPSLPPDVRAQYAVALANERARLLDAEGAQELYEQAQRLAPAQSFASAKLGAAKLHAQLGNADEALIAYEELGAESAEKLGRHAADAYAGLGAARVAAGDRAGAAEAYQAALSSDPNHAKALQGQGELLLEAGRPAEAVAPLARAVELAPDDAAARRALAGAHQAAGDPQAALRVLDPQAVPLEERAALLAEVAEIQRAQGDTQAAQLTLQQAVEIEPDSTPLRSALAKAYAENGDAEAAAAEQAQVGALTGIATTSSALASGKAAEGASARADQPVSGFAPLAASFPATRADGHSFDGVTFVGISQQLSWIERVRSWILPRVLDVAALEADVAAALGAHYELVPARAVSDLARPAYERVRAFSTDSSDLSLVNDELGVEVSFVAALQHPTPVRLDSPLTPSPRLEVRMHRGRISDEVEIASLLVTVPNPAQYMRWNAIALIPYAALLALLVAPIVRGWGRLDVKLAWEVKKNAKGFFTIEISRRPGQAKRAREKAGESKIAKYQRKGASWSRFKRTMAQRENSFRWIPARDYYVCVHGIMQDEKGEVVGNYLEERKVRVPRGRTVEVAFDFRPKEAALEVRLVRPEGDAQGVARVALRGVPSSLKFVKDEQTIFYVGKGSFTVVVGYGDCVYERQVEVSELASQQVTVGLGDPQQAVFQGVKDAIEPFLLGDLALCARALDKAGMAQKAAELRAKYHEQQGDKAAAAKFYREAGQLQQAAALSAQSGGGAESAELYEQAGDHRRAAEGYLEAGEHLKAAQAFEAVYDFAQAIEAYRRAGVTDKVMELLERIGRHHEAGVAALAAGDEERAIRNLQQVDLRDPDYAESCRTLAELFLKREEWMLAIDRLKEAVHAVGGEDAAPLELFEQLGHAFEKNGDLVDALQTFESIRKRDYQYAGVAERIRALRERAQAMETQRQSQLNTAAASAASTQAGAQSAPTQPVEERYEILGELGRGGMGIVFKARDRRLGRVVALKRLPDNLRDHPTAVALFLREAQSAAALNHPNIVTIYDADQANGNYYLTMEFLEGLPLDAILKKRGKLTPRDATRMAVQIATGLQFAHERGIVHRDIKTANLFFTRERVVKIMDFGLAKMVEEVRKAATVVGGTPYYMAPEQALGERVDHRADLYAFGVTLFELVAGRVPFRDGDVTYHHRHTAPPDVRELVPGIPEPLAALTSRLMAKKPEDRPATTAEVTAALDALAKSPH
jgi:tetratricopeptide (TPR) repeat protein